MPSLMLLSHHRAGHPIWKYCNWILYLPKIRILRIMKSSTLAPANTPVNTPVNTPGNSRYMMVEVVRGIAILFMIVYHFSWDLTYFGLADFGIFSDPYWIWFAKFIAGLILLVMGVTQVMA